MRLRLDLLLMPYLTVDNLYHRSAQPLLPVLAQPSLAQVLVLLSFPPLLFL
jgi:hypothetical protein